MYTLLSIVTTQVVIMAGFSHPAMANNYAPTLSTRTSPV